MHYEDDESLYDLQYEYLFGPDILIKPVVQPNQKAQEMYLPKDEWIHLWSGETYGGGQIVSILSPIGYPPVFYRKKSKFIKLFESITEKYHF
jgi:alpha-glucosidase